MGIEPRDLGALEKAVNDAAGRASNLWISFVFFATLIAITTGTVTHKDLFLEQPLQLPVLNVKLPLMGYFFAVPLFFVVFHFYVLLQLDGLAAKIEDYNSVLRGGDLDDAGRRLVRQRLDSFIFAQILVGARDRREGRIGRLNRAVAWITMVGMPIGTLLLLQLMFLPYHHQLMTWWHRICVLVDLGLVWFFWVRVGGAEEAAPAVPGHGQPRTVAGALPALRGITVPPAIGHLAAWCRTGTRWAVERKAAAAGAVVALFTTLVAVYPTEWIHAAWFRAPLQPLTSLLLEGDLSARASGARRLWLGSSSLLLADTDLGVEEKLVALAKTREALDPAAKDKAGDQAKSVPQKVTLPLRDRDLSYALLIRADLRQVDLTGANMRGAILILAQLQGADLRLAQLQGADLRGAQLQGADLSAAELQGADLSAAELQGADLGEAQLQGANLVEAQLQGADLRGAQLQGADLRGAQLQGAPLSGAQLQGADLRGAQLQGADLSAAQLQGVDLTAAQLQGANMTRSNVYRTKCAARFPDRQAWQCLHDAGASMADVLHIDMRKVLDTSEERQGPETDSAPPRADDPAAFRKLVDDAMREVPKKAKERASKRLSVLEPGARTLEQDALLAHRWQQERLRSLPPSRQAHILERLACGPDGAPHVARGLLRHGRLEDTRHHLHDLAARMRGGKTDASKCEGVKGFVEADWQRLDALVKAAPPKPDAPQSSAGK